MQSTDLSTISQTTQEYINNLKSDVDTKISSLESVIHDISLYGRSDILAQSRTPIEIGLRPDWEKISSLITSVLTYTPVAYRDLLPQENVAGINRLWESQNLQDLETSFINVAVSAGTEELKSINGLLIDNKLVKKIRDTSKDARNKSFSDATSLLRKYRTSNTTSNIEWLESRKSYLDEDSDSLLYKSLFDLAQESFKWATSNLVDIEDLYMTFTSSYNRIADSIVKANIAAYHGEVDANIGKLNAQIKKLDADIKIKKAEADETISEQELLVKQRNSRLNDYIKHYSDAMKVSSASLESNISGAKGLSDAYGAILTAYSARFGDVVIGRQ